MAARANPDHVIRKPDGTPWHDKQGLTWVNPYDEEIWEYDLRVAEEAVKLGFGEVQFDYIRFPEPYKSLPPQVFPNQKGRSKPDVLAEFLQTGERAPRQARRADDRGHLRSRDDCGWRARDRAGVGEGVAGGGCGAANDVPVALPAGRRSTSRGLTRSRTRSS